jgi:hypothetical protein
MGKSQEVIGEEIRDVMRRLRSFDSLKRKNATEVGWIAFTLGVSTAKAEQLVKLARARMAEEGAA